MKRIVSVSNSNSYHIYTYVVHEKTEVPDLYSDEAFKLFLARNQKRDVLVHQNWSIYINVTIKKIKDRYLISVALVNDSQVQSNSKTHQSNKRDKDKPSIETLFNSGIDISLSNAEYAPIKLDYFLDDYKYLYTIRNRNNGNELFPIGSRCIKKFERDDLNYTTSLYESLFKLLHAIKDRKRIELTTDYFSRKLLDYL